MRVAFFGGSFDPIHRGHLAIATAAADHLHLDTVLFSPAGRQPLKPAGATASFEHRVAMTALACAVDHRFLASNIDGPLPGGAPNYTVHVLDALATQLPEATLFNLVGLDSFLALPRWHQPRRLLELAEWIVVNRPGYTPQFRSALAALTHDQQIRIHPLDFVHEDISASELRLRLQHHDPCLDLIPAPVSVYIQSHHLYRDPLPAAH